ncbi:MAG: pantoate--beta-alanine ligase [Anaerolineae bacterium]|nr:pantoate--beta-alanine ligase [Anaerolineae bacterium]MDW8171373.1 pantoate--beta-alanine ligase [Anaerolineae bacterium]
MQIAETIQELRQARQKLSGRIGLVPTMGYLHEGHLSLVRTARAECDHVLATIFVNPAQFSAQEDLASYPRDLPRDLAMLEAEGVGLVFTPSAELMYPPGYQTYVTVEQVSQGKEGSARPGHFRGVATVVAKLFNLIQAQRAYFGQKDAQQVAVIRRMTHDLNFPLEIVVCPIVREADGLAMSSRNVYLSPAERRAAAVVPQAWQRAAQAYGAGERHPEVLRSIVREHIAQEPLARLDYVSVASARTLAEQDAPSEEPLLLSLAVQVGRPRLLDNCLLPMALNTREGASAVLGRIE